ncbi:MAG: YXWGXW repeat-containing protein [Cyclobacteriaceae bacterium]|nr:YXWGXW repeat-containing protein [Cyclobacteriaceae bacterium]
MDINKIIFGIGISAVLSGCTIGLVEQPPPAARIEVIPVAPSPHLVWINGHYGYRNHQYVWIDGRYVKPRPQRVWVPGHYVPVRGKYRYVKGHWK